MTIRCPQGRTWRSQLLPSLLTLPLLAGASGCAGTPWGERLSGSFPTPPEQGAVPQDGRAPDPEFVSGQSPPVPPPAATPGASPGGATPSLERRAAPAPVPPKPGSSPSRPPTSKPQGSAGRPPSPAPQTSATRRLPSPYRVTIRLPQADPSAPAEAVTQALRSAGIPFEVETIERVKSAAAAPLPDAGQGSVAPPSVRPAPPPR